MPAFPFNEFNYLSIQWIYWPDVWASIELSHLLVDFIYVVCTVHWYTLDVKVMQKILECFWYSSHTLNDRRWGKIKPSIFVHNTSEWRSKWIERWTLQSPKCLVVWVFARLISICRFRQTLQWHECLSVWITSLAIHRLTIWLFIFFFSFIFCCCPQCHLNADRVAHIIRRQLQMSVSYSIHHYTAFLRQ